MQWLQTERLHAASASPPRPLGARRHLDAHLAVREVADRGAVQRHAEVLADLHAGDCDAENYPKHAETHDTEELPGTPWKTLKNYSMSDQGE